MTEQDTPKMTHDEMIDTLKGLVFGTFDRTTAKEREALDMAISALKDIEKIQIIVDAYFTRGSKSGYECMVEIDRFLEPYKKGE